MKNILDLRKRVMARIYAEYLKSALVEYQDYFMFLLFMIFFFTMVSVHNVWENIPKDNVVNTFNFLVVALKNTSWIIQVLIAGFFVRIAISGIKLTYKNINTDWIMAKFKFRY